MSKKRKVIVLELNYRTSIDYDSVYSEMQTVLKKDYDWVEISESDYFILKDFVNNNCYTYLLIEENPEVTNKNITSEEFVKGLIEKQKKTIKEQEIYRRKLDKQRQERLEKNKAKQIERLQKKLEKLKNNE